jgi:hypothetical protein
MAAATAAETTPAQALTALAADFDRLARRSNASSLTRAGSIRGRAFREAAEMARARAGAGQGQQDGAHPVSPDTGSGSGALNRAEGGTP